MASAVAVSPAQVAEGTAIGTAIGIAEAPRNQRENLEAGLDHGSDEARWRPLLGLPCQLTVDLPLPHFTIADLLEMGAGSVIRSSWRVARDVPLRVNGTLIGWSEFEAVGKRLAVRLTELA
ncbi:MAG TPA: FliM/FliN family flagellar motor C-terminal domain-containing protein [Terriglobales bacterium]|nr:FliM/FliN family flagellar motor C-terminal domain-containing protein [Terriglobales bacterium]